jgi:hypothetical protein
MGEGQPTAAISRLVASTDNARVSRFVVDDGGSGYDIETPPIVSVTAGAASGRDDSASGKAVLAPTGRLLRLVLESGANGRFAAPPIVTIAPPRNRTGRAATAKAVLRNGLLDAIELLDVGEGYTRADAPLLIDVRLSDEVEEDDADDGALRRRESSLTPGRNVGTARYMTAAESPERSKPAEKGGTADVVVRAVLDYCVERIEVVNRGRGYGLDLPIQAIVAPPPRAARGKRRGGGGGGGGGSGGGDNGAPIPSTARATAVLESPLQARRLTSWLPAM